MGLEYELIETYIEIGFGDVVVKIIHANLGQCARANNSISALIRQAIKSKADLMGGSIPIGVMSVATSAASTGRAG